MYTIRASLIAVALAVLPFPAGAEVQVHNQDGVSYASGGVGDDERKEFEAISNQFNLKLTQALSNGHFVADTVVRVTNTQGKMVLDIISKGPLVLAKLPPATYTVAATLNGKEKKQTVTVGEGKQAQVHFAWATE